MSVFLYLFCQNASISNTKNLLCHQEQVCGWGSSWKSKVKPCFWRVHTSFSCLPLSFSIHYPLSFSMFLPPIITISLFILVARWRSQVTFLELAFQKLEYWTKWSRIEKNFDLLFLFLIFNDLLGKLNAKCKLSIRGLLGAGWGARKS